MGWLTKKHDQEKEESAYNFGFLAVWFFFTNKYFKRVIELVRRIFFGFFACMFCSGTYVIFFSLLSVK